MSQTRINLLSNYFGQGWAGLMAVAFLPSYVQYLGVEAFGLIGLFAVIQAIVLILDLGIGPTLTREMASFTAGRDNRESICDLLRSLETITFSVAAIVVLSAWQFSDYLAHEWLRPEHLPSAEVSNALKIMTLVAALRLCEGIYRASLYGLENQVWYNSIYAISSTVRYLGALALLAGYSATITSFFYWQVFVSVLTLGALASRVHCLLPSQLRRARFSTASLRRVWKFAGGMMGITLLSMLFLQMDKVLLSRLLPLNHLGYYTLASSAANIMFMLVVPATQAMYPQLVGLSLSGDRDSLESAYRSTTRIVTVATASAAMLLCFFSGGVVFMWSGNQSLVSGTASLLSILVIGSFLNGLSYLPHQLQIVHGRTGLLLMFNAFILIACFLSILVLVPLYGSAAAAWVWLLLNGIYLLVLSHLSHRELLPKHQWRIHALDIVLPTCGAIGVMLLASTMQPRDLVDRVAWLIFLLLTGATALIVSAMIAAFLNGWSHRAGEARI